MLKQCSNYSCQSNADCRGKKTKKKKKQKKTTKQSREMVGSEPLCCVSAVVSDCDSDYSASYATMYCRCARTDKNVILPFHLPTSEYSKVAAAAPWCRLPQSANECNVCGRRWNASAIHRMRSFAILRIALHKGLHLIESAELQVTQLLRNTNTSVRE
jgi:hypothetical protein